MAHVVLLTDAEDGLGDLTEHLDLLGHTVTARPRRASAAAGVPAADAVFVDARTDLSGARTVCTDLAALAAHLPVVAVFHDAGLSAVSARWQVADILLTTAGPAEVEARLRLATARSGPQGGHEPDEIRAADLVVDAAGYTARVHGQPLNLTYKEFELLKFLAQHPGRVFSREQLLQEVWGYDYFGGTRTVDVHVRRLRAKLGPDHEQLISTVRNVGYRFDARTA
ncbi:winged helix-turn-helix transcriptional regulator [Micrococcus lylae]|uniref:GlnR-family transcriptional regulator n=1 Tax=Micrococcus lylae TaxID=1273 RepID=A0A1R4IVY1_9MICC|nr:MULTISPECIES: winged helix-turn-helix domain-containing protein [Micrococcus]SJN23849.1 GlnR-family transcriptional regulator [Micrococcus lylae]